MSEKRIAGVILAAGGSSRMRRPKVLLEIDGVPMVRRVAESALDAGACPVLVVAGSEVARVLEALASVDVTVIENQEWKEGLGSSIARGVESVAEAADGILILLADQPFVTPNHLRELLAAFERGEDPVATRYGDSRGVPAIFGSRWFDELRALKGERGAKQLLDREGAALVGDGSAPADIDTEADYERVLRR